MAFVDQHAPVNQYLVEYLVLYDRRTLEVG